MKYNMNVSEFLKESKNGNIDYTDFYSYISKSLENENKKYDFITTQNKPKEEELKKLPKLGKLKGLPTTIKDCICTKNILTTAGAKILQRYNPPFDATCISRIKKEGAQIIAKTSQDEFGFGSFGINTIFNKTKNPNDITRCAGGSSGGAGVASKTLKFPHIAIGESTGGSISCPASFCGSVGLTPTYGKVSRYGLIDYANSLDKIGPLGKTTEDVAIMLSIISGYDPMDSTSINKNTEDYTKYINKNSNLKGLNIGIIKEHLNNLDKNIEKNTYNSINKLEELGANIHEISLKLSNYATSAYYIIATAEASTNLAKYCGMRYGSSLPLKGHFNEYFKNVRSEYLTEESKRRILLGTFARMAGYRDQYYLKAMKIRTMIINEYKQAFKKLDALVGPTMPIIAPKFNEIEKLDITQIYQIDTLTISPNLAGTPMLSIPNGTSKNMPTGFNIIANHLNENKIINIGSALENAK
jgi:aspartyl-tRNA(Asn)/glutamyl-tRNA(Gln) amidotransferase subunit A